MNSFGYNKVIGSKRWRILRPEIIIRLGINGPEEKTNTVKKLDEPRPQVTFDLVLLAGWAGGDGSLNGMPVVTSGWAWWARRDVWNQFSV